MRYVPLIRLSEGMVLARPIYGGDFKALLAEGIELSKTQIRRIEELGYPGAYITDDFSAEITVRDVVPDDVRLKTRMAAKELLGEAESGGMQKSGVKVSGETQRRIVMPVISGLIENRKRLVELIDLKPMADYNYYHAANVVVLSLLLGIELGVTGNELYELGMAALLHDVGNIFIPKSIMQKPTALSADEYNVVKQHTEMGFQFLRDHFDISIDACIGALQHHENYDGSGYPNRLRQDKISIYGRIIAVTDVYDALVSRRPFREPMYPCEAMEFMSFNAGIMFDPDIVAILRRVVAFYPTGVDVELSSGVRCIVVGNYVGGSDRPRLRLINTVGKTPLYIDLQTDPKFKSIKVNRIIED